MRHETGYRRLRLYRVSALVCGSISIFCSSLQLTVAYLHIGLKWSVYIQPSTHLAKQCQTPQIIKPPNKHNPEARNKTPKHVNTSPQNNPGNPAYQNEDQQPRWDINKEWRDETTLAQVIKWTRPHQNPRNPVSPVLKLLFPISTAISEYQNVCHSPNIRRLSKKLLISVLCSLSRLVQDEALCCGPFSLPRCFDGYAGSCMWFFFPSPFELAGWSLGLRLGGVVECWGADGI